MRMSAVLAVSFIAFLVLAASPGATSSPAPQAVSGEVRALWVPRAALTSPESIASLVRSARTAGFTTLLLQVRGRGDAYYRSDREPRALELDADRANFDPLAMALTLAHEAGLQVHAWVNVNLVSSAATLPRSRTHVVWRHPEWLMVPRDLLGTLRAMSPRAPGYIGALARWTRGESDRVEGLYLSPVLPGARAYTTSVIQEIVEKYPVDGVHLDYLRYPSEEFDYSAAALAEFRAARLAHTPIDERDRLDRAAVLSPAAWAVQQADEWATFRRSRLTLLVAGIQAAARAARPGITVTAAVVPSAADARDHKLQDWAVWAHAGYFDALCPMIYTTSPADFAAALDALPAFLGQTPFWAGIGAYRLPLEQTVEHIRLVRRSDAAGLAVFSYDKLAESGTAAASLAVLASALQATPPAISRR